MYSLAISAIRHKFTVSTSLWPVAFARKQNGQTTHASTQLSPKRQSSPHTHTFVPHGPDGTLGCVDHMIMQICPARRTDVTP